MSSVALKIESTDARSQVNPLSAATRPLADEIESAGQFLLETRTLSTRGKGAYNAAIRLPGEQRFVLGGLGNAVLVGFDGTLYEGKIDPGLQEVIAIYAAIFTERPELAVALHTHSPHLTAFAIAHKPFPIRYWSLAKRAGVDEIPLAEWAPRYSPEPVLDTLRKYPKTPAVLLKNRGLFAWSSNSLSALAQLLFSLDEGAEISIFSEILGGAKPLPDNALKNFLESKSKRG